MNCVAFHRTLLRNRLVFKKYECYMSSLEKVMIMRLIIVDSTNIKILN